MENMTTSIMNFDERSIVHTTTLSILYKPAYVFKHPVRLIVAYAGALAVFLGFILAWLIALYQNGTSASTGFLQIMVSTHGDGFMNRLAKHNGLGGSLDAAKDLPKLKVRFGTVSNSDGRHAAFATVDKTEVLLRGS